MDEIRPFLITVLVAGLSFLYWGRIRPIKNLFRRDPVLRDTAYGLSELRLPAGWRRAKELNDAACIEVIDPLRGRYGLVISEWQEDFDAALTLEQYSANSRAELTSDLQLVVTNGPESRSVDGLPAIAFEIEAVHDMTHIKYLHTALLGRRAFHQVIVWASRKCYSRSAFEELLDGFRETPGEGATPRIRIPRQTPRRIGF